MFDDYQKFTKTVAKYPERVSQLGFEVYLPLGIADEAGELCEKIAKFTEPAYLGALVPTRNHMKVEIIKEAGDLVWYVARFLDEYDLRLSEFVGGKYDGVATLDHIMHAISVKAGYVAGRAKKLIRDGGLWNEDQHAENLSKQLMAIRDLLAAVTTLCRFFGMSLQQVCQINQDKLSDRKDRGVLQGEGDSR